MSSSDTPIERIWQVPLANPVPSLNFNTNDENINWLYELIDWDKFISTGMHEWCKEKNLLKDDDDKHPSEEGHIKYAEQFIEPHLNARSLI